jgi:hypothetical protein
MEDGLSNMIGLWIDDRRRTEQQAAEEKLAEKNVTRIAELHSDGCGEVTNRFGRKQKKMMEMGRQTWMETKKNGESCRAELARTVNLCGHKINITPVRQRSHSISIPPPHLTRRRSRYIGVVALSRGLTDGHSESGN